MIFGSSHAFGAEPSRLSNWQNVVAATFHCPSSRTALPGTSVSAVMPLLVMLKRTSATSDETNRTLDTDALDCCPCGELPCSRSVGVNTSPCCNASRDCATLVLLLKTVLYALPTADVVAASAGRAPSLLDAPVDANAVVPKSGPPLLLHPATSRAALIAAAAMRRMISG